MGLTKVYLMVLSTLMLVYFCAGANLRLKRSDDGNDLHLDANGRCITAKNWKDDCNDCWCVANGVHACTLKGCIHLTPTPLITAQIEPVKYQTVETIPESEAPVDKKCEAGSTWKESCNSCWCDDGGLPVCTKIGCITLDKV